MINQKENEEIWEGLTAVAKKVVAVLEQEGINQGEALVVFSLAKAVLHHQPVKLPQVPRLSAAACNFYDKYPDLTSGVRLGLNRVSDQR